MVDFSGGSLSSDGGSLLLRQIDASQGLTRALAVEAAPDVRVNAVSAGPTLTDTVRREVMEELGLTVTPRGLMYVREYVGKNHAMHRIHGHFHQVEAVFHCDCADFGPIGEGRERDRRQVGFEWLPLAKLGDFPLSPPGLGEVIGRFLASGGATYLGDVH